MPSVNVPAGWAPVGTPAISRVARIPTGDPMHGEHAARVVGGIETGIQTAAFLEARLTEERPFISVWVKVAIEQGIVRMRVIADDGIEYPLGDTVIESDENALTGLALGAEIIGEGTYPRTVRFKPQIIVSPAMETIEEMGTTGIFYLDGASVTQSAKAYPQSGQMGPQALWRQAATLLGKEGGARPLIFDTEAWQIDAAGAGEQAVEPGDLVTIEEETAPGTVQTVEARAEEVNYGLTQGRVIEQRQMRLTERRQRLAEWFFQLRGVKSGIGANVGPNESVVEEEPLSPGGGATTHQPPPEEEPPPEETEGEHIQGVATVPSGSASVTVDVGQEVSLTAKCVQLTPMDFGPAMHRLTAVSGRTFDIELDAAAGADRRYAWRVVPEEGGPTRLAATFPNQELLVVGTSTEGLTSTVLSGRSLYAIGSDGAGTLFAMNQNTALIESYDLEADSVSLSRTTLAQAYNSDTFGPQTIAHSSSRSTIYYGNTLDPDEVTTEIQGLVRHNLTTEARDTIGRPISYTDICFDAWADCLWALTPWDGDKYALDQIDPDTGAYSPLGVSNPEGDIAVTANASFIFVQGSQDGIWRADKSNLGAGLTKIYTSDVKWWMSSLVWAEDLGKLVFYNTDPTEDHDALWTVNPDGTGAEMIWENNAGQIDYAEGIVIY